MHFSIKVIPGDRLKKDKPPTDEEFKAVVKKAHELAAANTTRTDLGAVVADSLDRAANLRKGKVLP